MINKKNRMSQKYIGVIGSSNCDYIMTMDHFPQGGETLEGLSFHQAMGGKGANQALAAQRSGGSVCFLTSLGDDSNGRNALDYYKNEGIDVSLSLLTENETTGTAVIWVDKRGENSIVLIPGANRLLEPGYIITHQNMIQNAEMILLQMEIPYETVKTICGLASRYGKKVILNAAPACPIEEEILRSLYILVVNETEAETITGEKMDVTGVDGIIRALLGLGVKNVILTLGGKGCIYSNGIESVRIPAFCVDVKDTTGAGDTFCGALAVGIRKYQTMEQALWFATAAAALSVTKLGAQPSIPLEREILDFLNSRNINI
ncbi:MAG TPA: ribokinase [Bacteroidales bacterium]|nr:ribokinase [Bacteroidales bacterium]